MTRRLRVVGIGMGPQHVTPEAAAAIASVDYVLAFGKSEDDPLLEVRREVCRRHGDPPVVVVADPPRERAEAVVHDQAAYDDAVRGWHDERAAAYHAAIDQHPGDLALLVWGDPSLYDSTLRIVDDLVRRGLELDVDVVPGISSLQLLAARHRIVLHEVGGPVHVTTGRRLREAIAAGQRNVVAMLNRSLDLAGLDDWAIWWGANLGAPGEELAAGRVADVRGEIALARERARTVDGWVMDLFLIRAPGGGAA